MAKRRLIAAIYEKPNTDDHTWTRAFSRGLLQHNVRINEFEYLPKKVKHADLHVFWGLRTPAVIEHCRKNGQPFICLDHGYTADRRQIASINLNHLNGKSELDVSSFSDDMSRCKKHSWEITPQSGSKEKTVVIGQVTGDKSLEGIDIYDWANFKITELELLGHKSKYIVFKPHPREKPEFLHRIQEVRAPVLEGSIEDAFKIAKVFCTYCSNAAVSAWLNGIPAWAASPMSMIYKEQFKENTPANRQRWLNEISFRQYTKEELASGEAWELLASRIIGKAPSGRYGTVSYERPADKAATIRLPKKHLAAV